MSITKWFVPILRSNLWREASMIDGNTKPIQIRYQGGTLVFEHLDQAQAARMSGVVWDERTLQFRAPAHRYRELVLSLIAMKGTYEDLARAYQKLTLPLKQTITPRPHQSEALKAWRDQDQRGTVALPTGAGKTILAVMAIIEMQRPTLIVVPTIDLMQQWEQVLSKYFDCEIGMLGGGQHEIKPLTVATYDSAQLHIERYGDRFGLLIFDECHHLPAPQYQLIALAALAPFRLGLSATVARADGRESVIFELVGPIVYEGKIRDMVSTTLAPYEVVTIEVPMNQDEQTAYKEARSIYTQFIKRENIRMDRGDGWIEFIRRSSRSDEGRKAMKAFWYQKRLSQAALGKIQQTWQIIMNHRAERILIFTDDNSLAYRIGSEFFVPVLTHKTRITERKRMLSDFREGKISVIATSKVLNEGVDVPEASVGIVLSGSGAVREHVQRLGRILRHREGKTAILYELVAKGTGEQFVNRRRKQHDAYEGPTKISST